MGYAIMLASSKESCLEVAVLATSKCSIYHVVHKKPQ